MIAGEGGGKSGQTRCFGRGTCGLVGYLAVVYPECFLVPLQFSRVDLALKSPRGQWHMWSRALVPARLVSSL